MKSITSRQALLVACLMLSCAPFAQPAHAEIVPQAMQAVTIDVQKLSTGYRVSKIIGTDVVSDANETIGKIDDLIVNPEDNKTAYVIISVGGWLGMGKHLVAVPYDNLQISSNKTILPGATKENLKALIEFKYKTN